VKKTFCWWRGALEKHRDHLAEQQEIVAGLSDIVMECYAIESSCVACKSGSRSRTESSAVMADAARVFLHDAADRVETGARLALAACLKATCCGRSSPSCGDPEREPADTIAMRQRISAAIQAGDRYPFEGR